MLFSQSSKNWVKGLLSFDILDWTWFFCLGKKKYNTSQDDFMIPRPGSFLLLLRVRCYHTSIMRSIVSFRYQTHNQKNLARSYSIALLPCLCLHLFASVQHGGSIIIYMINISLLFVTNCYIPGQKNYEVFICIRLR